MKQIVYNGVLCKACGKEIASWYRYDYKECGCPNRTMVDGGLDQYTRYGGVDMNLIEHISYSNEDDFNIIREKVCIRVDKKLLTLDQLGTAFLQDAVKDRRYVDWLHELLIKEIQYREKVATEENLRQEESSTGI